MVVDRKENEVQKGAEELICAFILLSNTAQAKGPLHQAMPLGFTAASFTSLFKDIPNLTCLKIGHLSKLTRLS